jgi:TonB family protein
MIPCLALAALLASSADLPRLVQTPASEIPYGAAAAGVAVSSQLLVLGVFRPAMLNYPAPPPPDLESYAFSAKTPVPTQWLVPAYPPMAVGSAAVAVEVTVGENGSVTDVRVTGSTPGFDDAAVGAARRWAFKPVLRDGRPVASRLAIVFYFRAPH